MARTKKRVQEFRTILCTMAHPCASASGGRKGRELGRPWPHLRPRCSSHGLGGSRIDVFVLAGRDSGGVPFFSGQDVSDLGSGWIPEFGRPA